MHTRFRRPTAAGLVAAALAVVALLLVPAAPAAAHNTLRSASPAAESRLTAAPTQVTLTFMQRLDPAFTTIALTDAARERVPTGEPVVTGTTGTVTIDRPLANGAYTVAYRVVSADGHPVQGSYRFTVADPAGDAGPAADAQRSATPASAAPAPGAPDSAAPAAGAPDSAAPAAGAPDSASSAPAPAATSAGPAAASGTRGGGPGAVALVAAAGILAAVVAGGAAILLRRRRTAT
ncbi:copper resistance CopC family protein [Micromonospora sp. NPDC004336]